MLQCTKGRISSQSGREGELGVVMLELIIVSTLMFLFSVGTLEIGLQLVTANEVASAVREGVRVAVTLPNVIEDDPRVVSAVSSRISLPSMFRDLVIKNTRPVDRVLINNNMGIPCAREITVRATLSQDLSILRLVGFSTFSIDRSSTMRYQLQPMCL